jgi:DNA-binding IclR family transcriptional regulator
MRQDVPGSGSNQALARGLHVLRALVEHGEPLTATQIAHQFGLHQSSISRILATLTEGGYVRKNSRGRFTPDFGLLSLASATTPQFPLITKPRAAMTEIADATPGYTASLCMLWNGQLIYFLRTTQSAPAVDFWASDFPIHLSAPGLRMLVDLPREEALGLLRQSRERFGWTGNAEVVPSTEEEVLDWAREHVAHDVLVLSGWNHAGESGAAIPIDQPEESHPLALALTGVDRPEVDAATLRLLLHDGRRLVENALRV